MTHLQRYLYRLTSHVEHFGTEWYTSDSNLGPEQMRVFKAAKNVQERQTSHALDDGALESRTVK
jgi:hypothetical protein